MITRSKAAVLAAVVTIAAMFMNGLSAQDDGRDLRTEFRYAIREFVLKVEPVCYEPPMSEEQYQRMAMLKRYYDIQIGKYEGTQLEFDASIASEDTYAEVAGQRSGVRCEAKERVFAQEDTEIAESLIEAGEGAFEAYVALGKELAASGQETVSLADVEALDPAWDPRGELRRHLNELYNQRHELCPIQPVPAHGGLWAEIDHSYEDLKARLEAGPLRHDFAAAEADSEYRFQQHAVLVDCMSPDYVDEETRTTMSANRYQAAKAALEEANAAADRALEALR